MKNSTFNTIIQQFINLYVYILIFIEYLYRRITNKRNKDGLKVIIVGPPRSGTSFLAGLIVRMGFYPGPNKMLVKANRMNPQGFYELKLFCDLDHQAINKISGDFWEMPSINKDWLLQLDGERKIVKDTVDKFGIEVYKGNMLLVLSKLYSDLFPDAKWVFITRNTQATIKSIKDSPSFDKSDEHVEQVIAKWMDIWNDSEASKKSLNLFYEDFFTNFDEKLGELEDFLEVELEDEKRQACKDFFKPSSLRDKNDK